MRDALTVLAVLLLIALSFLPAVLLGPVYFAFLALYFVTVYLAERTGRTWLEEAVSVVFALVFAHLIMEKLGRWDVRLFVIFAVLVLISAIRRLRNEGSANPDAR